MTSLKYRRVDGTFVAIINGLPYHVTAEDNEALFAAAAALADEMGDELPFEPPPEPEVVLFAPHLNNAGLARFSGSSPVVLHESIRITSATRISKGRYRAHHETAMPSASYSATPSVLDPNPCAIRVTGRTATYVEVRVVDQAGALYDPQEITIETKRVITE